MFPTDAKSIAEIISRGFLAANRRFKEMSGVWGLEYPIESYFSATIANELWDAYKNKPNFLIRLEEPVWYLHEQDSTTKSERALMMHEFGSNGSVDLALWSGPLPVAVIEVKRWGNNWDDLRRICVLIKNLPSMKWGFMPFATRFENADEDEIEQHLLELKLDAEKHQCALGWDKPVTLPPEDNGMGSGKLYGLSIACAIVERKDAG